MRFRRAFQQLSFLTADLSVIVNRRHHRWLTMWLWHGSAPAIVTYRLDRFGFLLLGEVYPFVRVLLWPFFFVLRFLGPVLNIHYRADIGPHFRILHPNMGVLVSKNAVCGSDLTCTGGNWISSRRPTQPGEIKLRNNVILRANAMVLGPVELGDDVMVAAGAVVVSDCLPGSLMMGVPARSVEKNRTSIETNYLTSITEDVVRTRPPAEP